MKISIIGTGYVGLVTGTCFADLGHSVIFVDVDPKKIQTVNTGIPPIHEKGLSDLLVKNKDRITATCSYNEAIMSSDISFICVGTPSNEDGSLNTSYIEQSAVMIGKALSEKKTHHIIIVKSTVLPGTTEEIIKPLVFKNSGHSQSNLIVFGMNPEFLKEGVAIDDFLNPDRIVYGIEDEVVKNYIEQIYEHFSCPKISVNIKTAEMIKYVSNAFLATKISFSNEIGNICKSCDIDTYEVFNAVGMDSRICPAFFASGIGYGGSCFPKDVQALIQFAEKRGIDHSILSSVDNRNSKQPMIMVDLLRKHHSSVKGLKIGILGLSFKPGTDDIRDSRAIPIIQVLLNEKANIIAYDPLATEQMAQIFPHVRYTKNIHDLQETDIIIITTAHPEAELFDYSGKEVIDGRRIQMAKKTAKKYEGVCW